MKKYLDNLLSINFLIFLLIIFYTWLSPSIDYETAQLFNSDDGRIFGIPIFASTARKPGDIRLVSLHNVIALS